jgi:hypothetical protein
MIIRHLIQGGGEIVAKVRIGNRFHHPLLVQEIAQYRKRLAFHYIPPMPDCPGFQPPLEGSIIMTSRGCHGDAR